MGYRQAQLPELHGNQWQESGYWGCR
jgi:hypothetical protein